MLITIVVFYYFFNKNYYVEYDKIKSDILSSGKTKIISIYGNQDVSSYEDISAKIEVSGKGTFDIWGLSSDANNFPLNVSIREVDSLQLAYFSNKNGNVDYNVCFDIGSKGVLGEKFNIKVNNINDIIIHYSKFKSIVDSIPSFPNVEYIKSKDGLYDGYIFKYKEKNKISRDSILSTIKKLN